MSFFSISKEELDDLVPQIVPGKFALLYNSPDRWQMYKIGSKPYRPSIYSFFMIDTQYSTTEIYSFTRDEEVARGPIVDVYDLIAIYDTEDEANSFVEKMMEIYNQYKEEIKEPALKAEIGLSILLNR